MEVFHSQYQLGQLYVSNNQWQKAENLFLSLTKSRADTTAPMASKSYGMALGHLGEVYSKIQKIQKADSVFQLARIIFKNTTDEQKKSKDYISLLSNQGNLWASMQKYLPAEKNLKTVLSAINNSSEYTAEAISVSNNLASIYRKLGRMGEAEPLYTKSISLAKAKYGENSTEYTNLLNNLGLLYDDMGNYEKAERLYKEVLVLTEKTKGKDVAEYATTLNNLGLLLKNTGRLDESESAFLQALSIRKKILGSSDPAYGASCNNLASLLQSTGRLKEAESYYIQAIAIAKNIGGNKNLEYANTLNNMAGLYEAQEMYAKATPYYQEALSIYREKLGERHPDYITTMNNLALLSEKQGDFKTAEILFKENAGKAYQELGKSHPNYATIISNLGALYESKALYKKADSLYTLALAIRKQALGIRHPDYTLTRYNLARLKSATKKYAEADSNWNFSLSNYLGQIKTFFPSMSEKEKGEFYHLIRGKFENYNSYVLQRYTSSPSVLSNMYNYQLETKALLLNTSNKVRNRILNSNDSSLILKYNQWNNLKGELANYYSLSKNELQNQKINTDSLEKVANNIEKELSLKSELFSKATDSKPLK
ncbi:MAG: tetratricopeptide repeat protein, partial [Cytophagales bacterium]|nr:tetratricopeptide repeat protein [Cytophagales bacterium]